MTASTVQSIRHIQFRQFEADGMLTVFPARVDQVPFPILRVFTIAGVSENATRANHAHRHCSQLLACLSGSMTVTISDSQKQRVETLKPDGTGLLIVPMLWNSVVFAGPSTVLAVFCDEHFEDDEYLRDWDEYVRLKGLIE